MITFSNSNSLEAIRRAVEISLLTWRKASPDDEANVRHGYWGDSFPPKQGALIGSRLWLLLRSKLITSETILKAEEIIREALQWLIDDEIATQIDVQLERADVNSIKGKIVVHLSSGETLLIPFNDIWKVNYAL